MTPTIEPPKPETPWNAIGAARRACLPMWFEVTEDQNFRALGDVPPIYLSRYGVAGFFMGEPADHDQDGRTIFVAFVTRGVHEPSGAKRWRYFARELRQEREAVVAAVAELDAAIRGEDLKRAPITARVRAAVAQVDTWARWRLHTVDDTIEILRFGGVIAAVCPDGDPDNDPEDALPQIRALAPGQTYQGGGGAAPVWTIERIPPDDQILILTTTDPDITTQATEIDLDIFRASGHAMRCDCATCTSARTEALRALPPATWHTRALDQLILNWRGAAWLMSVLDEIRALRPGAELRASIGMRIMRAKTCAKCSGALPDAQLAAAEPERCESCAT